MRADAPPFLSHPGRETDFAGGGGEQQGRDQYGVKDIKEGHPGIRNQGKKHGSQETTLTVPKGAFIV